VTETASTIINDALREIIVSPAETPIESYDASVGIFYLNAMMADFSVVGINLGYTYIDSLGDEVTIPSSAYDGVVKNLAVAISPVYQNTLASQSLFEQAQETYQSLLDISITDVGFAAYPSTLPVGSGNYYPNYPGHFYDKPRDAILTEIGGNIAPESP